MRFAPEGGYINEGAANACISGGFDDISRRGNKRATDRGVNLIH